MVEETLALTDRIVDLARRTVRMPGRTVRLTPTESKVLAYLVAQERPVGPDELLVEVWGYKPGVRSRTAITTMQRLRAKIEPDPKHPRHLVTEPDGSYAFVVAPADAPPASTNFPPERDAFVGRAIELDAMAAAFHTGRLVSLVGTPGVGKTRLASHFVARRGGAWPGGAWFVNLVPTAHADDVVRAIATELGLGVSKPDDVLHALRARPHALIVADNAEHVLGAVASVVPRLVAAGASVLVTSREALGVDGERVIEVGPLSTPDGVDLLVARATVAKVPIDSRAGIAELVEGLDGLPLAIELAVGRLAVLSLQDLVQRLPRRLSMLRDDARPARHATLGAAVASAWEGLDEREQRVLSALSVFASSFSMAAAEAIVGSPDDAVETLDVLRRRSLVAVRSGGGTDPVRFHLLLAVRDFARERLVGSELEACRARFRAWAATLADTAEEALEGDRAGEAQATLVREQANLIEAARTDRASVEAARIGVALGQAAIRSPDRRIMELLGEVRVPADPALAVALLVARADLAFWIGGDGTADQEKALLIGRASGDPAVEANALTRRAIQLRFEGRYEECEALLVRARDLGRAIASPYAEGRAVLELANVMRHRGQREEASEALDSIVGMLARHGLVRLHAVALGTRASIERSLGRMDSAERDLRHSLEVHERIRDDGNCAILLANLANLCVVDGRIDEAEKLGRQALALHRRLGARRGEAYTLGNLATVALGRTDFVEAERLFLESAAIHADLDHPLAHGTMLGMAARTRHAMGDPTTASSRYTEASARLRAAGLVNRAVRTTALGLLARIDAAEDVMGEWPALRTELAALPHTEGLIALVESWFATPDRSALRADLGDPAFEQRHLP